MKSGATWLVLIGAVVVLGSANYTIWQRQQVVDNGRPVLLELRPVDPRSLVQGDYMALAYADAVFPEPEARSRLPRRGSFIVALDADNVATFSRLDDGGLLGPEEVRIRYKLVDRFGGMRLGAESFFFQEGQAGLFGNAEYGVLHVDEAGNSVLMGLADENKQLLGVDEDTAP
jgi:uncharacterized membrane-anchored protein